MLEIEKYIKKHVGRKVLLTLTFSPSPNAEAGAHLPELAALQEAAAVMVTPGHLAAAN